MWQGNITRKIPENVVQCHVRKLNDGRDTKIVQRSCSGLVGAGGTPKRNLISGVEVTTAIELWGKKSQYNHGLQLQVQRTIS